jgi:hypothetical protein
MVYLAPLCSTQIFAYRQELQIYQKRYLKYVFNHMATIPTHSTACGQMLYMRAAASGIGWCGGGSAMAVKI